MSLSQNAKGLSKAKLTLGGKIAEQAKRLVILPFLILVISGVFGVLPAGQPAVFAQSTLRLEKSLRQELERLQQRIIENRQEIQRTQSQEQTLSQEIQQLEAEIRQIKLQIRATELEIQRTNFDIDTASTRISQLQQDITQNKRLIAGSLKQVYEQDRRSLLEMLLDSDSLGEFFSDFKFLEIVRQSLTGDLQALQGVQAQLQDQRERLLERRQQNQSLLRLQELERSSFNQKVNKREALIEASRRKRSALHAETIRAERAVQEIRQRLFVLKGLVQPLGLQEAYEKARRVGEVTGVRPAFIMAVLKRESDWGSNVGGGSWRSDMHPRDRQAFLEITKKLGLDPDAMPVSSKPSYGWGGAMGPAQFLPTTWLLLEDEIARVTGNRPPSPWDIDDAFAAAALLLARAGATNQSYQAEWRAAMRYFAGSNWRSPAYSFYGDGVMSLARVIQEEIEKL